MKMDRRMISMEVKPRPWLAAGRLAVRDFVRRAIDG
jgi:hypothetical protein